MYLSSGDLKEHLQRLLEGRCEIDRELGRGGMGVVFLARQTSLDRPIAIKVLQPHLAEEPEVLERFAREARTQSRLDHPNIVPILDVLTEGGLSFYLMAFVDGPTLRMRMTEAKQLPVQSVIRALREIGSALAHAHRSGVVHRDVKPENILIDPHSGRMMLTDFGIAKILDSSLTGLTKTFSHFGSPRYMAPEQAESAASADGRSDQYALAMIGYEMLAGRPAFDSPNPAELLFQHRYTPPPDPAEARPDAPRALCDALLRAAAKSPEDRFASMDEFVAALEGLDANAGTGAGASAAARRRPSPAARSGKPVQPRRRGLLLALAGGASVLGLSLLVLLLTQDDTPIERTPSTPREAVADPQADRAPGDGGQREGLAPVATLDAPATVEIDATARLDAGASRDPDGLASELRFRWDFEGDGNWDTPWVELASYQHSFSSIGLRTVAVQVRDAAGNLHSAQRQVRVLDAAPVTTTRTTGTPPTPEGPRALATARPTSGPSGTEFAFDASRSTDAFGSASALLYRWDFESDGVWDTEFGTEPTVAHRYDATGRQRARVQVREGNGAAADASVTVTVEGSSNPTDQVNELLARFDRAVAAEDLMALGSDLYRGALPAEDRSVFTRLFDRAEKIRVAPSGTISFRDENGTVEARRRVTFSLSSTGESSSFDLRITMVRDGQTWRVKETKRD